MTTILPFLALVAASAQQSVQREGASVITSIDGQFVSSLAPSPSGRWLAFTVSGNAGSSLSIVPLGGGSPRTLVPAAEDAAIPAWSGDGTTLAYQSERLPGIVVHGFDQASGALTGSPRRVTLEGARSFDISPDGEWIAYATHSTGGRNVIRLVPSRGGPARTVFAENGLAGHVRISPDGRQVYFKWLVFTPRRLVEVRRLTIADGAVRVVRSRRHVGEMDMVPEPAHSRIVELSDDRFNILSFAGDTVSTIPAGQGFTAESNFDMRLAPDGQSLLVAATDVGASIRVFDIGSGQRRDIGDASAYHWPVGWSADGSHVYYADSATLYSAALAGGSVDSVRLAVAAPLSDTLRFNINGVSSDGRHWLVSQRRPRRELYVYDSETRALRQVTTIAARGSPRGPGGSYLSYQPASREFVYIDADTDTVPVRTELRAVKPDGTSRLIRVSTATERSGPIAYHGERAAWVGTQGDSSVIRFATGSGPARVIWSSARRIADLAWSHDGRSLAVLVDMPREGGRHRAGIVFLSVAADGTVRETARTPSMPTAWDMYWTPDDRAVLYLEYHGGNDTRVARRAAHASGPATYVVPQGVATFWDWFPSPNGTHLVVPAEQYRGSSILRVDLAGRVPQRPNR